MKILLVEDDKKVSLLVKNGLEENGYTVDAAFDGKAGCTMALRGTYDLMILDILLPKMDGYEVLKRIQEKGVMLPVIFLTAKDKKEDIVYGLELGAEDYLVKPFSFVELLARIKTRLRHKQAGPEVNNLTVGNLTLDLINRIAQRDGKTIGLSTREFLLLEYLMRNEGQILNRSMILKNVWDYDFDTASNIIDVHINHLRSKIDKGFQQTLIHTIKGVGYVLKDG